MSRDLNVAPTFEMRQLARMTPGYVGADLASLLREAAINAVNRILQQVCSFLLNRFYILFVLFGMEANGIPV